MSSSTLSERGQALAKQSMRSNFSAMYDVYDSETNPTGFCNLGISENYTVLPDVAEFAKRAFDCTAKTFTYGEGPWGSRRLRQAMAKHMNKHFYPVEDIQADEILFANGVTSICEMLGFTIAEPGDGILVGQPIYQAFRGDFGTKANIEMVFAPFEGVDQFSTACVAKYEQALVKAQQSGTKVRALLICHPHNPLGQCYPRDTLVELMKLAQEHKIHLLMDEIYAMSVYDIDDPAAVPFQSCLAFDSSDYIDPNLLHVIYGFSKDFGAGGLRLGCMYIRNKNLLNAMEAINPFHWSGGLNEVVAASMLEDEEWMSEFFDKSRFALAEHNRLTRQILEEHNVDYSRGSNAGFFIMVSRLSMRRGRRGSRTNSLTRLICVPGSRTRAKLTSGKPSKYSRNAWRRKRCISTRARA